MHATVTSSSVTKYCFPFEFTAWSNEEYTLLGSAGNFEIDSMSTEEKVWNPSNAFTF